MSTPSPKRRTRNPEAYGRRWCGCCGSELPPYGGRGRPSVYCDPKTGRPCAEIPKVLASLTALVDKAIVSIPSGKRETFHRGFLGSLRQIAQDVTLTVAVANGDRARAARVGSKDPAGFDGA